ncbi:PadR family transcriptional regulator [Herbiconiux liukaitaii]|uniref:PadR family transcriptional regulator n=1 Tax=Herbiconiux liukaitaii TaxID=3342799 RepID=UPI0035B8C190
MDSEEEKILTNLRKGALEFCVLASLASDRGYGRDLAHMLAARGLLASEGTLYPLLSRLREAGLVDSELTDPGQGRQRRYYTLTPTGRARLSAFRLAWSPFRDTVDELLEAE